MIRIQSIGLLGRIVIILTFVLFSEIIANAFVLERVSRFSLQEDEARQMAEHLGMVRQTIDSTPVDDRPAAARALSTKGMRLKWQEGIDTRAAWFSLDDLREQLLATDPDLRQSKLRLYLMPLSQGGSVAGSLELTDHSTVTVHVSHRQGFWPLTIGRVFAVSIPAILLALLGGLMIRATLQPLRSLMRATRTVGSGEPAPLPEQGPKELRDLTRDFNVMQMRIQRLVATRTQALAAVGHDLRTPLARMELSLENAEIDPATRTSIIGNINEMVDLLESLQIYLGGEGKSLPLEKLDIAVMASTIIDEARDMGRDATYHGPASLIVEGRPVSIRRAISNLVDNALHYAGQVRLTLRQWHDGILILVEDDGPGIPADKVRSALQPFVRLDEGRARNTRGMGLGLAIVDNAIRAEGGDLTLENRLEGGLRVIIRLPSPTT